MKKQHSLISSIRKNKLAVAMNLALASCLVMPLTGCLDDTSKTGGSFSHVRAPIGSVTGLVQDTNGKPIFGATVSLAGQKTTTDVNGRYNFTNVKVTAANGADCEECDSSHSTSLNVFVSAPMYQLDSRGNPVKNSAGEPVPASMVYLNRTVSVYPSAQLDGTNSGDDDTVVNGVTTFVDGFTAEAQIAKLPPLTSSMSGEVRLEATGEAVAAGTTVTLTVDEYQVEVARLVTTTGENGHFSFTNVPTGIDFELSVSGFSVITTGQMHGDSVDTENELAVELGNVTVRPIHQGDLVGPQVKDITAVATRDPEGMKTVVREVDIMFSEAIAGAVTTGSLFMDYTDDGELIEVPVSAVALSEDKKSLKITTSADLSEISSNLKIELVVRDFADAAGNELTDDDMGHYHDYEMMDYLDLSLSTKSIYSSMAALSGPYVKSVEGVLDLDDDPGAVAAGTTQLKIIFSEAIATTVSASDVFVGLGSSSDNEAVEISSVTLGDSNTSLTIELAAPIGSGEAFFIDLTRTAFADSEENILEVRNSVDFESWASNGQLRLTMESFDVRGAGEVVLVQQNDVPGNMFSQAPVSHAALTSVMTSESSSFAYLYQLNGLASDQAPYRLGVLADELNDVFGLGMGSNSAEADRALVTFDVSANAEQYLLEAPGNVSVMDQEGNSVPWGWFGDGRILYPDDDVTTISIMMDNVEPGDALTVIPVDPFGTRATSTSLTLADNVPPAVVRQRSYGVDDKVTDSSGGYGNGGEQSALLDLTGTGVPYLNIAPGLLGTVSADDEVNDHTLSELYALNTNLKDQDGMFENGSNVYDATAIAAFTPVRTVGIAFSENIAKTAGADFTVQAAKLTSGAGSWEVNNDVIRNDDGNSPWLRADLLQFKSNNVLALANTDHGQLLDFAGLVEDTANAAVAGASANVAAAGISSQVMVRDAMPPLVKEAVYTGHQMTITFNEPIRLELDSLPTLSINGQSIYIGNDDAATLDGVVISGLSDAATELTGTVLVLNPAAWNGERDNGSSNLYRQGRFNLSGTDDDGNLITYDDAHTQGAGAHGRLDTRQVEDVHGNSWASDSYGIYATPYFAMLDVTGPFDKTSDELTPAVTGKFAAGDDSETVTLTYTFKHPVDLNLFDRNGDGELGDECGTDDADVIVSGDGSVAIGSCVVEQLFQLNGFAYSSPVAPAVTTTAATVSADGMTLAVTIDYDGVLVAGNSVDLGWPFEFTSAYDQSARVNPEPVVVE